MFRIVILMFFVFLECSPVKLSAMDDDGNSSDSLTDSLGDVSDEDEISESDLGKITKVIERSEPGIHVFVFKVGQGNFCVIRKDSRAIVVDAGSSSFIDQDVIEFKDCKALFEACLCRAKIYAVIITHADLDHYNFLADLETYMDTKCFFVLGGSEKHKNAILEGISSPNVCYYLDLAQHFFNFVEEVSPRHLKFFEYADLEERLNAIIPGSIFQFLQPLKRLDAEKKNDYSLVFKVTYNGNSILFTGDANGNTYEACFREVVGEKVEKRRSKKENIDALKGINLFMIPHHGADTEGSPIWTDVVIKHSATTLVGAIVSVGVASPYKHPTSFLHEKPWPYTMQTEKTPVIAHWKQKGQDAKKTSKNMHARILETWLSFGVFDFVFTDTGGISLLEKKEGGVFLYSHLVKRNVPIASYEVAEFLWGKRSTELNLVERFALGFLPEPFQRSLLGQRESLQLSTGLSSTVASAVVAPPEPFTVSSGMGAPPSITEDQEAIPAELKAELANAGYQIQNVSPDGNCAFWAVLVANGVVRAEDTFSAKEGDPAYSKMINLRKETVAKMEATHAVDASTITMVKQPGSWNMGSRGGIDLGVLGFIARAIEVPIMGLLQEPSGQYRYWISGTTKNPWDDNLAFHDIEEKDLEKLLNDHPETVKLFHNNIHYQAIVKQ